MLPICHAPHVSGPSCHLPMPTKTDAFSGELESGDLNLLFILNTLHFITVIIRNHL